MSEHPTATTPSESPDAQFRTPPLGAIIAFGVVALAGLALLIRGLVTKAVATCHGAAMAPDDTCTFGGRRTAADYTQDFQTRLDIAQASLHGQQLAGALVILGALVTIGLLVAAWRRDLRLVEGLAQERPEHGHVDRGLLVPVFGAICAIVLMGAGGYVALGLNPDSALFPIVGGLMVLAGLAVLVMSRPKGATALLVYPSELGVVSRGARSSVPYTDVTYFVGERTRSFNWAGSGRGDIMLSADEAPAFRDALAQRAHTAWVQAAPQRLARGESVEFGDITLDPQTLTIAGTALPLSGVAGIRAVKDSNATYYEALDAAGAVQGRIDTSRVAHAAVLRQVLAPSGITLP